MYNVRFGVGIGDEVGIVDIEVAKLIADGRVSHTKKDIVIEDEDGNEIFRRKWCNIQYVPAHHNYDNPILLGVFGFYTDWE
ncbi:MAG: hypothetical protein JXB48_21115 [Candidatus Latescibacteria bacterium]|nr:hypothetical protein [Candidatus Latescibacterota bacterium]